MRASRPLQVARLAAELPPEHRRVVADFLGGVVAAYDERPPVRPGGRGRA